MSEPQDLFERFQVFLPGYLTSGDKRKLFESLQTFPGITDFYAKDSPEELLQGDGWTGFLLIDVDGEEPREVEGLIVSNSCDIDVSNPRKLPPRVLFAPLIPLVRLETLLLEGGQTENQVESYLADVRRQYVTNIFYLPSGPYGPEESIVFLDDVRPNPLGRFLSTDRQRRFRLSLAGFYILVLKLSIHFSRMLEGVRRVPA